MLLKLGAGMMLFAAILAAVVAVVVNGSDTEEPAEVAAVEQQASETPPPAPVKKDRPYKKKSEPKEEPAAEPREAPRESEPAPLPLASNNWPKPSREEVSVANEPRYYPTNGSAELTLIMQSLGVHDAPVINSTSEEALAQGVIHVPETPMPWDERRQKNVYLAGHRLGFPGTGSRMVFFNLDKLADGDSITLKDGAGTANEYEVSEVFVVGPNADWAMDPVRDRDMVTLQTCTYPNFENRIIVRADRV